jgi:hypothetical protein
VNTRKENRNECDPKNWISKIKSANPFTWLYPLVEYYPKISRIYPSDILVIIEKSTTQPSRTGDGTIRGFDGLTLFLL